jgi:hypothetical protein
MCCRKTTYERTQPIYNAIKLRYKIKTRAKHTLPERRLKAGRLRGYYLVPPHDRRALPVIAVRSTFAAAKVGRLARDAISGPVTLAIAVLGLVVLLSKKVDTLWVIGVGAAVSLASVLLGLQSLPPR